MTTPPAPAPLGRQARSRPGRPGDGLAGRTVLVAGTAHTTARAAVLLAAAGAAPLPATVVTTVPVEGPEVEEACAGLRAGRYGWLAITSSAAWRALRRRPGLLDRATAPTNPVRVAVVGPATADAVRADDVTPLVPEEAGGAAALVGPLVAAVRAQSVPSTGAPAGPPPSGPVASARVLFACGDLAASTLTDGLRDAGLDVDVVVVYRTVPVTDLPAEVVRAWRAGTVDDVVLTSPSAVGGLLTALGPPVTTAQRRRPRIAAIGDTTAAAATAAGLPVDVVGDASLPGLVRLLAAPPGTSRPVPPPVRVLDGPPRSNPADARPGGFAEHAEGQPDEPPARPQTPTDAARTPPPNPDDAA